MIFQFVQTQLIKCSVWSLVKCTMKIMIYAGVSLYKNLGIISSRVYCIYFESTNGNVYFS